MMQFFFLGSSKKAPSPFFHCSGEELSVILDTRGAEEDILAFGGLRDWKVGGGSSWGALLGSRKTHVCFPLVSLGQASSLFKTHHI